MRHSFGSCRRNLPRKADRLGALQKRAKAVIGRCVAHAKNSCSQSRVFQGARHARLTPHAPNSMPHSAGNMGFDWAASVQVAYAQEIGYINFFSRLATRCGSAGQSGEIRASRSNLDGNGQRRAQRGRRSSSSSSSTLELKLLEYFLR